MTDTMTVCVLPGKSLTLPDGRIVTEGEEAALPSPDAEFAIQMGAAEIPAAPKKAKNATKTQD